MFVIEALSGTTGKINFSELYRVTIKGDTGNNSWNVIIGFAWLVYRYKGISSMISVS